MQTAVKFSYLFKRYYEVGAGRVIPWIYKEF